MNRFRRSLLTGVPLAVLVTAGILFWINMRQTGFSARVEPTKMEAIMAASVRNGAIPERYKQIPNPVPSNAASLAEGRAHFADHCALCHGNKGDGQTMLGKGMYPRPTDLRAQNSQQLSDGQMYWIVKNGIRLSGMPAFGDPGDDDLASWKLVSFMRHLPRLTTEEEQEMEHLNPKGPDEWQEEVEENQFLKGGAANSLCANISETSKPSTITVGRGKKSHFDEHKQDKQFFRCVGSFGA